MVLVAMATKNSTSGMESEETVPQERAVSSFLFCRNLCFGRRSNQDCRLFLKNRYIVPAKLYLYYKLAFFHAENITIILLMLMIIKKILTFVRDPYPLGYQDSFKYGSFGYIATFSGVLSPWRKILKKVFLINADYKLLLLFTTCTC